MKKITPLLLLAFLSLSACDEGPTSPRGFSLPQGDAKQGELVFLKYQCLACHSMTGYQDSKVDPERDKLVELGGEVTRVVTYADLVTSIINPSHRIAKRYLQMHRTREDQSPMRNYNDVMKVTELVDLVTFLQSKYKIKAYAHTQYGVYD